MLSTMRARRKQSYHTALIVKHRLRLLSPGETDSIPRSTLSDWDRRDVSRIIGYDDDDPFLDNLDFHRQMIAVPALRCFAKGLYHVYRFYASVCSGLSNQRSIWREHREQIVTLVDRIKPLLGTARPLRMLRISPATFHRWKNEVRCESSPLELCRRIVPGQLTRKEVSAIADYLTRPAFAHWPRCSAYYQMLRDRAACFSLSTFYKYARLLAIKRQVVRKPPRKRGIRADRPFQIMHMDVTLLRVLDHSRVRIQFIVDNFSRAILGWKAALAWTSGDSAINLAVVCEKFGLFRHPFTLMVDDGSENLGQLDVFLDRDELAARKLVAQVDTVFSNSMVEALNKKMKYEFLYRTRLDSIDDVIRTLEVAVPEFNDRPHGALFGATPNEVLAGAQPDPGRFGAVIADGRRLRRQSNRLDSCGVC